MQREILKHNLHKKYDNFIMVLFNDLEEFITYDDLHSIDILFKYNIIYVLQHKADQILKPKDFPIPDNFYNKYKLILEKVSIVFKNNQANTNISFLNGDDKLLHNYLTNRKSSKKSNVKNLSYSKSEKGSKSKLRDMVE
jgi:hypothetical protein